MSQAPARQKAAPERRREWRQQRRKQRLRQLWQILVLSGTATGLGWFLLREGWVLRSPSQIEVLGKIGRAHV